MPLCGPASRCLPDSSAIARIATHSLQGTTALRLWPCFTSAHQLCFHLAHPLISSSHSLNCHTVIPCKQPVHLLFGCVAVHVYASVVPITSLSAKPTSHSLECRPFPAIRNCMKSMVCYSAAADCWFSCSLPGPLTIACTATHLLQAFGGAGYSHSPSMRVMSLSHTHGYHVYSRTQALVTAQSTTSKLQTDS